MRYLVLSDIHGASEELTHALSYFDYYQCDYLVLLGDLLNHGPRNRVPESYQPPMVAEILNAMSHKIISVRGNCDSEVDSMMFAFPCNAPYGYLLVGKHKIFLTHGHLHKIESDQLGLQAGDIVFSGHTHVAGIFVKDNGLININPGSPVLPKGGTKAGFGLILEDRIELRDLDNNLVASHNLN